MLDHKPSAIATADVTTAPFKATTDVTSSITPGTAAIDRLTQARQKTDLFVGYSYEHGQKPPVDQGNMWHLWQSWLVFRRNTRRNFNRICGRAIRHCFRNLFHFVRRGSVW